MILGTLAFLCLSRNSINIRDFGAVGDGVTLDTKPIQRAIDSASNGRVVVPKGTFLTGSLHLKSGVELHLAKGAILLGSPDQHDYDKGIWKGFILADGAHDISVSGPGTIDGNGAAVADDVKRLVHIGELKIPPGRWRPSEIDRPEVIEVTNCRNVKVTGITIKGGSGWTETYRDCLHLNIDHIKVDAKAYWNNDGVDVVDCKDVRVTNCDFDADDDGVCLKSDKPDSACENVFVAHCRIRSSASAVKFGTSSHGGFKHVTVTDIHVHDTFRSAIALESVDGATLEDIKVSHIRAVNTGNAFFIRLGHRTLTSPPGRVRNVSISDMEVQVPAGRPDEGYPFPCPPYPEKFNICPSSIVGIPEARIIGVRLKNITIRMPGGASPQYAFRAADQVPERKAVYPEFSMFAELPCWAVYFRHVRGVQIQNLRVILDKPDYRPAFVVDDAGKLSFRSVIVKGADPKPKVIVRSSDVSVPKGIAVARK